MSQLPSDTNTVLIASYLEPAHVERIRSVDPRLRVIYAPELLRPPRYPADHSGQVVERSAAQETRWRQLLGEADILFDFDQTHREDLPELATRVRWIQATSSGIGQFVARMGYDVKMPTTIITTASGIHAQPLAEFCVLSMLYFAKGVPHMVRDQARRHWKRYAGTDLAGKTLGIIGVGRVGQRVARFARAFDMRVLGVKRHVADIEPASIGLDELYEPSDLDTVLRRAEYLVLSAPHTDETEDLLGARELSLLPRGAVFINIGRGASVDEQALVDALQSGQLGGASLDVFAVEPPPSDNPLWAMSNVLISPHSGSTSDRENGRLTDLFCENLRRFLAGEPLLNVLERGRLY